MQICLVTESRPVVTLGIREWGGVGRRDYKGVQGVQWGLTDMFFIPADDVFMSVYICQNPIN